LRMPFVARRKASRIRDANNHWYFPIACPAGKPNPRLLTNGPVKPDLAVPITDIGLAPIMPANAVA